MKKIWLLLVAVASMFFMAGCADSPKDVVGKWATAISEGDIETANEYSTPNVHAMNALMIAAIKEGKSDDAKKFVADMEKIEQGTEEINGDTAKVKVDDGEITLKKVDGDWKVDIQK